MSYSSAQEASTPGPASPSLLRLQPLWRNTEKGTPVLRGSFVNSGGLDGAPATCASSSFPGTVNRGRVCSASDSGQARALCRGGDAPVLEAAPAKPGVWVLFLYPPVPSSLSPVTANGSILEPHRDPRQ